VNQLPFVKWMKISVIGGAFAGTWSAQQVNKADARHIYHANAIWWSGCSRMNFVRVINISR